jgi:hypothetical protein
VYPFVPVPFLVWIRHSHLQLHGFSLLTLHFPALFGKIYCTTECVHMFVNTQKLPNQKANSHLWSKQEHLLWKAHPSTSPSLPSNSDKFIYQIFIKFSIGGLYHKLPSKCLMKISSVTIIPYLRMHINFYSYCSYFLTNFCEIRYRWSPPSSIQ